MGSNQYRTRVGAGPSSHAGPDLMAQAANPAPAPPTRLPCSQVWGGSCTATVAAPTWAHAIAGVECKSGQMAGLRKRAADLPVSVLTDVLVSSPDGYKLLTVKNGSEQLQRWVTEHFFEAAARIKRAHPYKQYWNFCKAVLGADWCSHELIKTVMAEKRYNPYQFAVISQRNCPRDLLEHLMDDADTPHWMLLQMANQKCVDIDDLVHLATHPNPVLRQGVARQAATPPHLLQRLACDEDPNVRKAAVSQGHRLPHDLLVQLSADKAPYISRLAMKFVDVQSPEFERAAIRGSARTRSAAARRVDCPPQVLEQLARDADAGVRILTAENPSCPSAGLIPLADDKSHRVRMGLARNTAIPVEAAQRLAHSTERLVRLSLASNPACPGHVVVQLAADDDLYVRERALKNPNLPEEYRELRRATA